MSVDKLLAQIAEQRMNIYMLNQTPGTNKFRAALTLQGSWETVRAEGKSVEEAFTVAYTKALDLKRVLERAEENKNKSNKRRVRL